MATAFFRVKKDSNFTIVSNYHLQDKNLSLKAKGLLTLILSLPDDWDMTLKGLVSLSGDGVDSVRSGIQELEKNGYLRRSRNRNEKGQLLVTEYTVYECPALVNSDYEYALNSNQVVKSEMADNAQIGNPDVDENTQIGNPNMDKNDQIGKSDVGTKPQIGISNVGKSIYGKSNTIKYLNKQSTNYINNYHPSTKLSEIETEHETNSDETDEIDKVKEATQLFRLINKYSDIVKENISYDELICLNPQDKEFLDLVIDVMLEAICSNKKTLTIAGQPFLQEVVKSQLLKLNESHIEYVQACIADSSTKIKNIRAYLLTALYNSIVGADLYWEKTVKSDFNQG